jgi:molybdopterin/thiamine biosynthesis adenylyltransferase
MNASELAELLRFQAPEAYGMLCELLINGVRQLYILFGTETEDGKCAFLVSLQAPFDTSITPGKKRVDRLQKGFRPGSVPVDVIAARFFSTAVPVKRGRVERVDAAWIHGRDHNHDLLLLRKLRVAIIGCGAIGSMVARALAQAGVGYLLLIDPDFLKWENLSRHQLGASALKENIYKTAALKANIEMDFPHILRVDERHVALGLDTEELWQELERVDLVVSLTGSWTVENLLNRYKLLNKDFPPIIYGWMEPHAAAGHAVAITSNLKSCLQCGFNQDGTPKIPITYWPHANRFVNVPACADPFSPYGANDLSWSQTLISEMALDVLLGRENSNVHRVWFGNRRNLESKGGAWNPDWIEAHWDPGNGWFVNQLPWMQNSDCSVCTSGSAHAVA